MNNPLNTTTTIQPLQKNSTKTFLLRYSFAFLCIVLTGIAMWMAQQNPNSANDNYYMYLTMILMPLIIAGFIVLPIFSEGFNFNLNTTLISVLIVVMVTMYYFMKIVVNAELRYVGYMMYLLGIAIVICLLAMIYKIFYRIIRNVKGTWATILSILFLLPCMLLDGIEALSTDFKNTATSVKILAFIEFCLIFLFFYAKGSFRGSSEVVLLGDPKDLHQLHNLGDDSVMFNPSNGTFRENYGISMWFYINTSHSTHGSPIPVFARANISKTENKNVKYDSVLYPLIEYDQQTQKLKITVANENSIFLDIQGQKWNHLAISMDNGNAIIFMNGELIKTIPYTTSPSSQKSGDNKLSVGWNTDQIDGLFGAICNVVYYKTPLTPDQVARMYNLYLHKNPPI